MPDFFVSKSDVKEGKKATETRDIFGDPESGRNIVMLFNLLLKVDRRINPQFYALESESEDIKNI
jgi:hypothetical protein